MSLALLMMLSVTPPITKVNVLQLKSITLTPPTVTGGATVNGVVTLSAAAGQAVTVKMTSSAPQIADAPQNVTIQSGATSATFIVQTHPVSMNPNAVTSPPTAKISAQMGLSDPLVATLTVAPPGLSALTLNPATVAGANPSTGTVTISGPAPAGGLQIALSMSGADASPRPLLTLHPFSGGISVPSQVTIPAGAASATFTITTRPVSSNATFPITATFGAFQNKKATLTVTVPDVSTLTLSPGNVVGGKPATGTVTLTGPAPEGGLAIKLKTDIAYGGTTGTFPRCGNAPTVPATVTVTAGARSGNFTVTTFSGYGVYWVEATPVNAADANFWAQSKGLDVDTPSFKPVLPSTAKGGTPLQGKVQLTGPAMPANCGNRYILKSSNTSYAQVPAYVDVPSGSTEAPFSVSTSALPASSAPVQITISTTGTVVNNLGAPPGQQTSSANVTITP